jgi:signal transduction histidine kinase
MLMRQAFRAPVIGYGWVRPLPLLSAVATLALLHTPGLVPSGWDWALALGSALCVLAGGRFPLAVLLGQCVLLAAGSLGATLGTAVVQALACVALGEVALRRPGRPTWAGVVALTLASATNTYPLYSVAANEVMVATKVGLPLLLGSFLRSQRELARQAEQRATEAERRRAWEVTAARASERGAIARELHDVVAHHVASIVLRAGVAGHVVPDGDPRLLDALTDVRDIGGQALTDLRGLVGLLRDPGTVEDTGLLAATDLAAALTGVLDRTRQAGVRVDARIDADVLDGLDTVHRHAVFRVAQEGLTNVLKHAGPGAAARVRIGRDPDGPLVLEVSDRNGGGSPVAPVEPGHGLIVMHERVQLLGGTLEAGRSGDGWTLRATLPWRPAPDRATVGAKAEPGAEADAHAEVAR